MMLVLNDMSEYLEYDAEKTNRFIDDLLHALEAYNSKAAMLYSVYGRYAVMILLLEKLLINRNCIFQLIRSFSMINMSFRVLYTRNIVK